VRGEKESVTFDLAETALERARRGCGWNEGWRDRPMVPGGTRRPDALRLARAERRASRDEPFQPGGDGTRE